MSKPNKVASSGSDWAFSIGVDVCVTLMHCVCIMVFFNLAIPDVCPNIRKMTLLHSLATVLLIRALTAAFAVGKKNGAA